MVIVNSTSMKLEELEKHVGIRSVEKLIWLLELCRQSIWWRRKQVLTINSLSCQINAGILLSKHRLTRQSYTRSSNWSINSEFVVESASSF